MAFGQRGIDLAVDFRNETFTMLMQESEPAAARALTRSFRSFMVRLRRDVARNMLLKRRTGRFLKGVHVKHSGKQVNISYVYSQITYNWYAAVHEFGGPVERKATTVKAHKRRSGGATKMSGTISGKNPTTGKRTRKRWVADFDIPAHKRRANVAIYQPKLNFRRTYENLRSTNYLEETIAKNMIHEMGTVLLKSARRGSGSIQFSGPIDF